MVMDNPSLLGYFIHDFEGRGFAFVADVGFVGHPQEEDLATVDRFLVAVEGGGNLEGHPVGHHHVDVARGMDHGEVEVEFFGDVLEVEGIERDAVATDAGTGVEGLETVGFGLGGIDHLPDVDVHFSAEQRHLVDEADVDEPVGVLQDLDHLGCLGRTDRIDGVDGVAVDGGADSQSFVAHGAQYLGGIAGAKLLVARIYPFGREGEPEVGALLESRLRFEDREHEILGGGGIGGALEADEATAFHVLSDLTAGHFDVVHVGFAELVERGGDTDQKGIAFAEAGEIGGGLEVLSGYGLGELQVGDVADIVDPAVDLLHLGGRLLEADDPHLPGREAHRQRQTHIAQADDADEEVVFPYFKKKVIWCYH